MCLLLKEHRASAVESDGSCGYRELVKAPALRAKTALAGRCGTGQGGSADRVVATKGQGPHLRILIGPLWRVMLIRRAGPGVAW